MCNNISQYYCFYCQILIQNFSIVKMRIWDGFDNELNNSDSAH